MTLPSVDTTVTYPSGALTSTGVVLHREALGDGRLVVVLDETACHPVDAAWPDQGADRGSLAIGDRGFDIVDCVVGATDGSQLFLGADIPVRKGTEGWAFVVAHSIVASEDDVAEGSAATVSIDAAYRTALSVGHTACHLASLALNASLAGAWTKEVTPDAYGNPNFDALAIETSTILENGSLDVYRLGKSLRKKGFTPAALTDDPDAVSAAVTALLSGWAGTDASATVRAEGPLLTDRRYWETELDGIAISIPCGGTHSSSLGAVDGIRSTLSAEDAGSSIEVRMSTVVPA